MAKKNSKLSFNNQCFTRENKPYFLLSGELHYFRVESQLWSKHLELMKQAELNTVSSYVPWSLHEQIEGEFDFSGKYAPNLNLIGFIELCKEKGLDLILKPGPYILAELAMHGIPKWFFKNYPQTQACDSDGKPYPAGYSCLCHPDYIKKSMLWYDAVMPIIAEHQNSNNGPISMLQVCNEVGLFQWLGGSGDYSTNSVRAYQDYLKITYDTIDKLNKIYGSSYADFEEVNPPIGKVGSKAKNLAYVDWHCFHRKFYAEYIKMLTKKIQKRDVDVPLFHNVPGWVYGRAKNMPVCLSMYHELVRMCPDIIIGIDHIPENISYRNFHDDQLINKFTKAIRGSNGPLYVAELQAGTREANVRVYPNEMELFYKACLANGIVGMNYYMFSQGQNPPGWSIYDSNFYLQTPLNVEGETDEAYSPVIHIGKLIRTHGKKLCNCQNNASQALVFYPPYYYSEFIRPLFTGENFEDRSYINCSVDTTSVTNDFLFDGIGKLLAMDNQEFDAVDITNATTEQLDNYKQIWLGCTEQMDADSQNRLLDYVQRGGHLICFPTLPKLDLRARDCSILANGLCIESKKVISDSDGIIQWTNTNERIHAQNRIEVFEAENSEIIATTTDQQPCCIRKACGKGSVTVFGSAFSYQAKAHKWAWQKLSIIDNFRGAITCNNPLIITTVRDDTYGSGFVFMLNYHNQRLSGKLNFSDNTLKTKSETIHLAPLSGVMLPFNLALSDYCKLIKTTSEIISVEVNDKQILLETAGDEETAGQIVLQTTKAIKGVLQDNKSVNFKILGQNIILNYHHCKHSSTVLIINFNTTVPLTCD